MFSFLYLSMVCAMFCCVISFLPICLLGAIEISKAKERKKTEQAYILKIKLKDLLKGYDGRYDMRGEE